MKVLHHPKEGDVEVGATLDPMTIDYSMGLVSKEVSLAGEAIVVAETRVGVCSVVGASDPVEGSSKTLCLIYEGGVQGEVFVKEFAMRLIDLQRVRHLGTSAQGSCCTFEPCPWLVQG